MKEVGRYLPDYIRYLPDVCYREGDGQQACGRRGEADSAAAGGQGQALRPLGQDWKGSREDRG